MTNPIFDSHGLRTGTKAQHELHTDGSTDPRSQTISTREIRRARQRAAKRLAKKQAHHTRTEGQ